MKVLNQRTRHITTVLENVYQPHNISAVMRSCECFGVQDLHIIESVNSFRANKDIALGASKWISLHRYPTTSQCLSELKSKGYRLAALSLRSDAEPLEALDISEKLAICIGTEETGLSDEAHDLADQYIKIPMFGFTQSFNLSVTTALCLYELNKHLRQSNMDWSIPDDEKKVIFLDWLKQVVPNAEKILNHML